MTEEQIGGLIAEHGLWVLFFLTLIEGPVATLIGGIMVGEDLLAPVAVLAVAVGGDLAGDLILYGIGRFSPGLTRRLGGAAVSPVLDRTQGFRDAMHLRSWQLLVLGKWTHVLGFAVILAAGAARVPFGRFAVVSTLATVPKVAVILAVGWAFGRIVDLPWIAGAIGLGLLLGGVWLLHARRAK